MGYMHLVGLDVEHTHEKSNYYFELAAKQGLVEGEYQLAINLLGFNSPKVCFVIY